MLDHPDQDLVQSVQVKVVDDLAGIWYTTCREHFTGKLFYITIYFLILFTYIDFYFFLSGYFKGHSLKYQMTLFPNGMVAGVFGAAGAHNDVGVLNYLG